MSGKKKYSDLPDIFTHPDQVLQDWKEPVFQSAGVTVKILRGDLFHPLIQGNKWYKLRHYAEKARLEQSEGFLSIGGAWSNHLIALAAYAAGCRMPCRFLIRGAENEWQHNPAVLKMRELGAELSPISRSDFRTITPGGTAITDFLPEFRNFTEVPLGASSPKSAAGAADWARILCKLWDFTDLVLPVASGGTCAGFLLGLNPEIRIHAVDVLASGEKPETIIRDMAGNSAIGNARLIWHPAYHFGAYARSSPALETFRSKMLSEQCISTDHIYSGKAFFAVSDLADKKAFLKGSRILVIHTGGIFQWNSNR